jgi:carbamoyltransferase
MLILGISCYYHDSAAAIVRDGNIIAAAQEERFTRIKHDSGFPKNAIEFCLKEANCSIGDIDYVSFYDKPFLKFERLLESYLAFAPKGLRSAWKGLPIWIKEKLWISDRIKTELNFKGKLLFPEHHQSHAASAFYPSPFKSATIITMDGVGEWVTSSISVGNDHKINMLAEQHFPHSLGLLYSAFTYYTGFRVNSGEYKLMGLAPYGQPRFAHLIYDRLMDLKQDGSFELNQKYFNYASGLTMTNAKFNQLFGGPPRKPESEITQREMDIAASIQKVTEDIVLKTATHAQKITGEKNLCLAGGVALNCVANGKLKAANIFENIWIQPSSGDAGGALGAALFTWHQYLNNERSTDVNRQDLMTGSYLGPEWSDDDIIRWLDDQKINYHIKTESELIHEVASNIANEKVVGWFQGRMEFGPRALGNRSILGDPRSENMQKVLNLKIKYRESFRPFAPSVLANKVSEYFEFTGESPYMLMVSPVHTSKTKALHESKTGFDKLYQIRSSLPAITHVDNSARIQTVHPQTNPKYYTLIQEFEKLTGTPVLINTSFNVRGEPIVCSPEDAFNCFMRTEMDILVLGNILLFKNEQPIPEKNESWKMEFKLD